MNNIANEPVGRYYYKYVSVHRSSVLAKPGSNMLAIPSLVATRTYVYTELLWAVVACYT